MEKNICANYASNGDSNSNVNHYSTVNSHSNANWFSDVNSHSNANRFGDVNSHSNANRSSDVNFHSNANYISKVNHYSNANYISKVNFYSNANCLSDANSHSNANFKCKAMYRTMFCFEQTGKAFMMFNKQLTEAKYNELEKKINIDFSKVRWTNAQDILERLDEKKNTCLGKELKLENDENSLKGAWKPVLEELKKQLTTLDIWDDKANEVVEKITGYNLNELNNNLSGSEVEVKLNGKTYKAIIK